MAGEDHHEQPKKSKKGSDAWDPLALVGAHGSISTASRRQAGPAEMNAEGAELVLPKNPPNFLDLTMKRATKDIQKRTEMEVMD